MGKGLSIPTEVEVKAVALIARGDKHELIANELGISIPSVRAIKQRNKSIIATIEKQMLNHQVKRAAENLEKANQMLGERLDEGKDLKSELKMLNDDLENGRIDYDTYRAKFAHLNAQMLTTPELVSISKEMHNQTKVEGDEKSKFNPNEAKEYVSSLVKAIEHGDEVALERIVFNPKIEA